MMFVDFMYRVELSGLGTVTVWGMYPFIGLIDFLVSRVGSFERGFRWVNSLHMLQSLPFLQTR
jgi:hypothetical protein